MTPHRIFTLLIATTLAALAMSAATAEAQPQAQAQTGATETAPARSDDAAVLTTLQTTLIDASYDRVDFERVIQQLREQHDLNIHVSWPALEALGVRRDQRIEMHLKQVSLMTVLEMALREAAAGTQASGELIWHVQDGIVIISTGEHARETTITRIYDVSDLLESGYSIRRFAVTPVLGLEVTGREFIGGEVRTDATGGGGSGFGGGGGGGRGGSAFGEPGQDVDRLSEMERIQQVIDLIVEQIEPDSWDINGGDVGCIRAFNGSLIIDHTLRAHDQIEQFLQAIRSIRPQAVVADAAIIRLRADKAAQWRNEAGDQFPSLSEAQVSRALSGDAETGALFRATSPGYNGQRIWFSALTQRETLSGYVPIVGDGVNAFSPRTGVATSGLELIVLPQLESDGQQLTLDVQMAWIPPTAVTARPARLSDGEAETTIDMATQSMRSVSSTSTVQTGAAVAYTIPQELGSTPAEYEDWLIVRVRAAE